MTIDEVAKLIDSGASVVSVVEQAIERAKSDTSNTFLSVIEKPALERAAQIDERLSRGEARAGLMGIPFAAKDNILTYGAPTTAASHMLESYDAPYQATVIERLESAGAICIGKTNLDSFAHGGSTENSYFGPTHNAHDDSRVAGGSSGGSAVAVAKGIVPFAIGTDTGGSIRQPASFNGVVGYKPTYGSVSRYGVVAMASSTDVVGPLATTVDDARLVYETIYGVDERDSTTVHVTTDTIGDRPLKVGLVKQFFEEGIDDDVRTVIENSVQKFTDAGHQVEEVDLPILSSALAVYYIVVPAELSSNLARYDGIKYGTTVDAAKIEDVYEQSRSQGFMDENKRRILIGNYVLSSGYYDAYYHKAQTVRTKIINAFDEAFSQYDVLIGAVAPTPAFKIGEKTSDPLAMYLADTMTTPASLAGLPAISIPAGQSEDGLPIGLQIMAPRGSDFTVLEISKSWEKS